MSPYCIGQGEGGCGVGCVGEGGSYLANRIFAGVDARYDLFAVSNHMGTVCFNCTHIYIYIHAYIQSPTHPLTHSLTLLIRSRMIGSLGGGHYTAHCRFPGHPNWMTFNDSTVNECSESSVQVPALKRERERVCVCVCGIG